MMSGWTEISVVKTARFACVIGFLLMLAACGKVPETKSRFLSNFSAAEAIKSSSNLIGRTIEPNISSSETSWTNGSRRAHHHDDSAQLRIPETDQGLFLEGVMNAIKEQVRNNGCTLGGEGAGNKGFSIAYADGSATGWIDVWGVPGAADNYTLIITITES
jgi:hypothetical protein